MQTGSGFVVGALYSKNEFARGILDFQATARVSFRGYQQYGVRLAAPRLLNDRLFLDVTGVYNKLTQVNFYGIGPDTSADSRTNYRNESFELAGTAGVRPVPWWEFGAGVGILRNDVGRGTNDDAPTTRALFSPDEVLGLALQPDYRVARVFAKIDYLDGPNPRSGGQYLFRFAEYDDRSFDAFNFGRFDIELYQYVPFFNQRRVIVARFFTSMTDNRGGQKIPFYLQPTLGGSRTLRGFREFRFQYDNFILINIEYRWEVFSGLDMAAFWDAGKVAAKRSDLDLEDLETSYGIGFRFNTANGVFFRFDVGHGREGTRFFVKFGHVF